MSKYSSEKTKIGEHLKRLIKRDASDFVKSADKEVGETSGYIAQEAVAAVASSDKASSSFMIKSSLPREAGKGITYDERSTFIREFITAPLYRRILYSRAPVISAVEGIITEGDSLNQGLRSEFIEGFTTLTEVTGGVKGSGDLGDRKELLKSAEGAEKLFASMLFLGEYDYGSDNIGVISESDGKRVLAKIDHGWSGSVEFDNSEKILAFLWHSMSAAGYAKDITVDANKFIEAIHQISQISDDEIETIASARIEEATRMGFDIKGVQFLFGAVQDNGSVTINEKTFGSLEEYSEHLSSNLKRNRDLLKDLAEGLSKDLAKDSEATKWVDGSWLPDLAVKSSSVGLEDLILAEALDKLNVKNLKDFGVEKLDFSDLYDKADIDEISSVKGKWGSGRTKIRSGTGKDLL